MNVELSLQLKATAQALGFNMIGVIPAAPGLRLNAYLEWIGQQYHGEMGYMARPDRVRRRLNLNHILPGVKSIVCVGLDYHTGQIPGELGVDPSRGRISNYAWGQDYHDVMTPRLQELAGWLQAQIGRSVASKVYVDTGAILERDHGERAGLGFMGKNTMLIAPRRGSWFFLGEMLTTAVLPYDQPSPPMPSCGRCRRCLDTCPTQAFPAPYVLDARRCISYLTIELKGWIPKPLRPMMGNWIYGCDVCQDVCPFNRFALPTRPSSFQARDWERAAPPLLELLTLDEESFQERFAQSPIKRIKRARFLRNVCVAAGNWGSRQAVSPLISLLDDPAPIVRGHAAWALLQIGGSVAEAAISSALKREIDESVRLEMQLTG